MSLSNHEIGKQLDAVAKKFKSDPVFKNAAQADGWVLLEDAGIAKNFPTRDAKIMVLQNTDTDYFFVLPPDPNSAMNDEQLNNVAAAKGSPGCASSAACASTVSTAFSCIGCASSASSAGSVGA